jgi:1,2-diacylglycerol 3-alpha-glucosyltransferase
MKILHIGQYYLLNYSYQENYLPNAMANSGRNEVIYLASNRFPSFYKIGKKDSKSFFDNSVYVIHTNMYFFRFLTILPAITGIIRRYKPDLIFVHGYAYIKCIPLLLLCKIKNISICMDIHEDFQNSGMTRENQSFLGKRRIEFYNYLNMLYSIMFSKFIFQFYYVAPSVKEFCLKYLHLPKEKLQPLYLGFDHNMIDISERQKIRKGIQSAYLIPDGKKILITAGKFTKEKNLIALIKSVEILPTNIVLLIVGSIDSDVLNDMMKISMPKNVITCGWKDSKELLRYILAADLAVYPGTQSVLWQQTVCLGTPAIFRYWHGIEYLGVGSNRFIHSGNPDEIAEAIEIMVNSDIELCAKRGYSLKYGASMFDYRIEAERIITDYKNSKYEN